MFIFPNFINTLLDFFNTVVGNEAFLMLQNNKQLIENKRSCWLILFFSLLSSLTGTAVRWWTSGCLDGRF